MSGNSLHFIELEGSLPHSQQPATYPYPEPEEYIPCLLVLLLKDPY